MKIKYGDAGYCIMSKVILAIGVAVFFLALLGDAYKSLESSFVLGISFLFIFWGAHNLLKRRFQYVIFERDYMIVKVFLKSEKRYLYEQITNVYRDSFGGMKTKGRYISFDNNITVCIEDDEKINCYITRI